MRRRSFVCSFTYTDGVERRLAIIEGDTAKITWEVTLGDVDIIRSTPVIVDVDGDLRPEIAIVYDTDSALEVDLWAPEITVTNQDGRFQGTRMRNFGPGQMLIYGLESRTHTSGRRLSP